MGGHLFRGEAELRFRPIFRALGPAAVLILCSALPALGSEPPVSVPSARQPTDKAPNSDAPPGVSAAGLRPLRSIPDAAPTDSGGLTRRPPEGGLSLALPWDNGLFQKFRLAYLSPGGRKWLETVTARSRPYAGYVAERIRWYRLPEELIFLPVIESEWSAHAVSRSGAAGLWQFMRNSIAGYDMRVNEWVDERRDFMKSTDAALRKLGENYEALGSWEMALAAYNCGLGAALRAAERGGTRDYWELSARGLLPAQTVSYVPKFLAVASLLNRGARNGFPVAGEDSVDWERVSLDGPLDLSLLSEASGIPMEVLRTGNPELRYGLTPPDGPYALKVPAESAAAVRAVLAGRDFKALRYYQYKVRSGDTLSALARHYEVSVALIQKFNPGLRPELLRIGSTLIIPALKDKQPYAAPPTPGETLEFTATYTVARGDTLWAISLRYGVQPEILAERNGLDISSILREGMTLNVPRME